MEKGDVVFGSEDGNVGMEMWFVGVRNEDGNVGIKTGDVVCGSEDKAGSRAKSQRGCKISRGGALFQLIK